MAHLANITITENGYNVRGEVHIKYSRNITDQEYVDAHEEAIAAGKSTADTLARMMSRDLAATLRTDGYGINGKPVISEINGKRVN